MFNDIETRLNFPKKLNGKKNLLNLIKLYTSRNPIKENNIDIMVTGTLINTSNRIIAYNLRNKNTKIKVINISHGHNWIWDEAYNEVPEYEYVDYYLSYGKPRSIPLKIKKNLIYVPKVVGSSCDIINNIKKNYSNLNIKKKNFINSKFLYISREYQINGVLPHMFSDKLYNLWHKILLEKFKTYDLTIKIHPKAKTSIDKDFFSKKNKIENEAYINEKIFKKYDIFIFDTITSAFTKVAATNKPIIFFNLNERKCTKEALKLIKKRTNFFEMKDINRLKSLEKNFKLRKKLNNEFVNNFSLYKKEKRQDTLTNLIDNV